MLKFNLIFAGGGLANGLAAYRLKRQKPHLKIALVEGQSTLGGSHTWSFHHHDLTADQHRFIQPFISKKWPAYQVKFPQYNRTLYSPYASITSHNFHTHLSQILGPDVFLKAKIKHLTPNQVSLRDGRTFKADCVVDGRGWQESGGVQSGYQKFLGLDVELNAPHGLTTPLLMDALEPQTDGFRFFYLLPWSRTSLLVEDTYYSNSSYLNKDETQREIMSYITRKGWSVHKVIRTESGVLPVPMEGSLPAWKDKIPCSGSKAGLFHSVTGYSLAHAVRFAEAFSKQPSYESHALFSWARSYAERHWKKENFFRLMNRLMFRAADPGDRYKVLQKFYQLPEGLVDRFYAGRLKFSDPFRIFSGKPPVALKRAVQNLLPQARS